MGPHEDRRFRPSGNAAAYLGLYDTERIEARAGDRIRWTRNRKAPPARFKSHGYCRWVARPPTFSVRPSRSTPGR